MWTSHLGLFLLFQIYRINFRLKLTYLKKTPIKFYKFEHMKYICVEKIHVAEYEKLQIYFKIKVMGGIL